MESNFQTDLGPKTNSLQTALAYGLWLVSAALSVLTFIAGREMIIRTYLRLFPWEAWRLQSGESGGLPMLNYLISMPLAILMIVIIIGGFEYQHRNANTPQGWRMLARTFAVEFGVLLLAFFL